MTFSVKWTMVSHCYVSEINLALLLSDAHDYIIQALRLNTLPMCLYSLHLLNNGALP